MIYVIIIDDCRGFEYTSKSRFEELTYAETYRSLTPEEQTWMENLND